jgi:hypothetical protein
MGRAMRHGASRDPEVPLAPEIGTSQDAPHNGSGSPRAIEGSARHRRSGVRGRMADLGTPMLVVGHLLLIVGRVMGGRGGARSHPGVRGLSETTGCAARARGRSRDGGQR